MKYLLILCSLLHWNLRAQIPIDTTAYVSIGGIRQFISVKGKDRSNPLLLFLHGGPGSSMTSYSNKFTQRLQEHFTVVQWDQRQTGKTLQVNSSQVPLSLNVFQQDVAELTTYLLKEYKQSKLYLAGHSWGTALGFYMAENYPDLLYGYIAIAPMIYQLESERMSLALMKEKAKRDGNQQEMDELSTVHIPFENGEQLYYHRKWLLDFTGSSKNLSKDYVVSWAVTWLSVFNEASACNLIETLPVVRCPVYFLLGRKDYQTNSRLTEQYYSKLTAPAKGLFWFERSGHFIPSTEPIELQKTIIEKIFPETFTGISVNPVSVTHDK